MAHLDFISSLHHQTKRNYLLRVTEHDKATCATKAKEFGFDYFDGDRCYGYGGYRYDGRWIPFAKKLIEHYQLKPGQKVLDIGCGKGFLVNDLRQALPGLEVVGLDVSSYAIDHGMPEVKEHLRVGTATTLPYPDQSFDLVLAINVLHNLRLPELSVALGEMERVCSNNKYIVLDSYRNEQEKVNLIYWQITCECFFTPAEWEWIFQTCGYRGDWDYVFFQ